MVTDGVYYFVEKVGGEYTGYSKDTDLYRKLCGVFDTREKAEKYIENLGYKENDVMIERLGSNFSYIIRRNHITIDI